MPIQAQLDTGYPGQSAPLEGADESKSSGLTAAAMGSFIKSPVIGLVYKGLESNAGGTMVTQKDAQAKMKAQGYDSSVIPESGITSGALDVIMQRQSDIKVNESVAQRANLSGASRFVASLAGGLPDPSNVALMAFAPELKIGEAGVAARAAVGAAEGAGYTAGYVYGSQAINHTLGDADESSMQNLRTIIFGGVVGGGLHAGFGGKAPTMTKPDLRDTIFTAVQKAEDATGKGIITVDSGGLTKFGISQNAHPDVDVANLTQEKAAGIIKKDYWDKIGGETLPVEMQHTALDAAVNQGVENAKNWLRESGGDPEKFNYLREQQYRKLAQDNPAKYGQYLNGWLKRLQNVKDEPLLAPDQAPRVASVDQMGANVDELPAETRNAAGEAAVNQFLHDDEVNVDQVINKSLEEVWGVKPDSDFDPTGGTGPRSALTIEDEHEAHVNDITNQAYEDAGSGVQVRKLSGDDAFPSEEMPDQFTISHKGAEVGRMYGKYDEAAQHFRVENIHSSKGAGSLGTSMTRDVLKQLRDHYPDMRTIGGERISGARGNINADYARGTEVSISVRRRLQGDDTDLTKAIPQRNRGLVTANDNARIKLVKDTVAQVPKVASETDGPLTAAAKASTAEAVAEAKGIFESVRGPYVEDKALTPEQNAAAKEAHEAPLVAFKEQMSAMDEIAKEHEASAAAVEAAVRCASQLGED